MRTTDSNHDMYKRLPAWRKKKKKFRPEPDPFPGSGATPEEKAAWMKRRAATAEGEGMPEVTYMLELTKEEILTLQALLSRIAPALGNPKYLMVNTIRESILDKVQRLMEGR